MIVLRGGEGKIIKKACECFVPQQQELGDVRLVIAHIMTWLLTIEAEAEARLAGGQLSVPGQVSS